MERARSWPCMGYTPFIIFFGLICNVYCQVLTPPYFNLASIGGRVVSSSTCGEGVSDPELFCELTGVNADGTGNGEPNFVIQGQFCDYCDVSRPEKYHPAENVIDATEKWWQSPPLSRGLQYNEVNLTIDLGQTFHVAYVFIKMANSPRPGLWALEHSSDGGSTWTPWQYFAESYSDCNTHFGNLWERVITRDDSILCTTEYSKILPLRDGEIIISLVNGRPSSEDFTLSPDLQEWTSATNIRLRLLRTQNLFGHFVALVSQDESVTRRYFYSIKEVSLGGRCVCNGHADVCDKVDPSDPFKLECRCQHNTCGPHCDHCCSGFYQKPWKPATAQDSNECEPCQCFGHSTECMYDEGVDQQGLSLDTRGQYEGGGVCLDCQHNTEGINCEKCLHGYYQPSGVSQSSPYACQPCRCDPRFSTGDCLDGDGACVCKPEYTGANCDRCNIGYKGRHPYCEPCECNVNGTLNQICDVGGGQCPCKPEYEGRVCDKCIYGYYNFPSCRRCRCDPVGSYDNFCETLNGQCKCRQYFTGKECNKCDNSLSFYPNCKACDCDTQGSVFETCDGNGMCKCKPGFSGPRCDTCTETFHRFPHCTVCICSSIGSQSEKCSGSGQCQCKPGFIGMTCDKCAPSFFSYPFCRDCECHRPGVIGSLGDCDSNSGQCTCKEYVVGMKCSACQEGTFNLQDYNVLGCQDCGCAIGASRSEMCSQIDGQCTCKPNIEGLKCNRPLPKHYFPDLFQHKYEIEEGYTPSGGLVRYRFEDTIFPDFSWKGYAIFSSMQEEVLVDVNIKKSSLYMIILRYINLGTGKTKAHVSVIPASPGNRRMQSDDIVLEPSSTPGFGQSMPFTLSAGQQTLSLKTSENVMVDYLVLLPKAYYEASALQQKVKKTCSLSTNINMCNEYAHISLSKFSSVRGEDGFVGHDGNGTIATQLVADQAVLQELGIPSMALLNSAQPVVYVTLPVTTSGKFMLVVQYHSLVEDQNQDMDVHVATPGSRDDAHLVLPSCPYSFLCRQVVTDIFRNAKEVYIDTYANIYLTGRSIDWSLDSITAIPESEWDAQYIQPKRKCVQQNKQCIKLNFPVPVGAFKVDLNPESSQINFDAPAILDLEVPEISGTVPFPHNGNHVGPRQSEPYVLVAQYYQPESKGFDVEIKVSDEKQLHEGHFSANFCPALSGCRSAVQFPGSPDSTVLMLSGEDFILSVANPSGEPLSLMYIMAVPAAQYNPDILDSLPVDHSVDFIQQCAQNSYSISVNASSFCQESVYSLTVGENSGALPCDCDDQGSNTAECQLLGGQCDCKPNVMGRTCSLCKPGFYNFPYCKACNCTYGVCDQVSGQCGCPSGVTGDKCDTCFPETFGLDPVIGCESCHCDWSGVIYNDLNCNNITGQCSCKPNVGGRQCDQCVAGFYNFPTCPRCVCERSGSKEEICQSQTGDCLCKKNVEGYQCSRCRPNTFFLEERNPLGCTECFCFGVTNRCESSGYRRSQVHSMKGWSITNMNAPKLGRKSGVLTLSVEPDHITNKTGNLYWVAPETYLGNKVTSYGGQLLYTVTSHVPSGAGADVVDKVLAPDVYLHGNNIHLVYMATMHPAPGIALTVAVDMLETMFVHETDGSSVTREEFMLVLAGIDTLQIRASHYTVVDQVQLEGVYLDIASRGSSGSPALNVEMCHCPSSYSGTSCEECAEGFYRSQAPGPLLNTCTPCECNGLSDKCDPISGDCVDCKENRGGPECLDCRQGYYEDPANGHCKICGCPLPIDSNNFVSTCEVLNGKVHQCKCLPGYSGPTCDSCDLGYFGNPTEANGSCQACDCSNNIDITDPQACDVLTGECLCINNSTGDNCESCQDWFWGDAVDQKDCKPCNCNQVGSEKCDSDTGVCLCKPIVVGPQCDQCWPGYYGLDSGSGCLFCNCSEASVLPECDLSSGQCECQPGVGGCTCDQCSRGYWNYTDEGCQDCNCSLANGGTCDPENGTCQCLPGAYGDLCDQCQDGWVFLEDQGCEECGECEDRLFKVLDVMNFNVSYILEELEYVSVSVESIRRLDRINDSVSALRPVVEDLLSDNSTVLDPISDEVRDIEPEVNLVEEKGNLTLDAALQVNQNTSIVGMEAEDVMISVKMATNETKDAVTFAEAVLDDILNSIHDQKVEELIKEAEQILKDISEREFLVTYDNATLELDKARKVLEKVKKLQDRVMDHVNETSNLQASMRDILQRLDDLTGQGNMSLNQSDESHSISQSTMPTLDMLWDSVENINSSGVELSQTLMNSRDLLGQAIDMLADAQNATEQLVPVINGTRAAANELMDFVMTLEESNSNLSVLVTDALQHAIDLNSEVTNITSLDINIKELEQAMQSLLASYQEVNTAVKDAARASKKADAASTVSLNITYNIPQETKGIKQNNENISSEANDTKQNVEKVLDKLEEIKQSLDAIKMTNVDTRNNVGMLHRDLGLLPKDGYAARAKASINMSMDIESKLRNVNDEVRDITNKLPGSKAKAKQLETDVEQFDDNLNSASAEVEKFKKELNEYSDLVKHHENRHVKRVDQVVADIQADITSLRDLISLSREEAGRIKIGVNFSDDTVLQIRNPPEMEHANSYTKLSLFFKTAEQNGFLAYIGPSDSSLNNDFLHLEIINGNVVFHFDLGGGQGVITNPRNVGDNKWHEVIAERTGKVGTLTVRSSNEVDSVAEGESPGDFSNLDIDQKASNFFIGGVPQGEGFETRFASTGFTGCIEDVKFDGYPLGLWNFVEGKKNNIGCLNRDTLLRPSVNGFKFDGDGYVIFERLKFKPTSKSMVTFQFKTSAENGLMFLMGDATDFMSLELQKGHVVFRYDLGLGPAILESGGLFNDGQWHKITANRQGKSGLLKVDENTVLDKLEEIKQSLDAIKMTNVDTRNNVGMLHRDLGLLPKDGYAARAKASINMSMDIESKLRNVNDEVRDITNKLPGSKAKAKQLETDVEQFDDNLNSASAEVEKFKKELNEYSDLVKHHENRHVKRVDQVVADIQADITSLRDLISLSREEAGRNDFLHLEIINGNVVFHFDLGGGQGVITNPRNVGDNKWHEVIAERTGKVGTLTVRSSNEVDSVAEGESPGDFSNLDIDQKASNFFIGGVPQGEGFETRFASTGFTGCIEDVKFDGYPLGLWNFVEGKKNNIGCLNRDTLLRPSVNGFKFDGDGYVIFERLKFKPTSKSMVTFQFKTSAENGLMFLMGDATDFMSLELQKGHVVFRYDLGLGPAILESGGLFNDGQWHKITANRQGKSGLLKVDENTEASGESPGIMTEMSYTDDVYIGGNNGTFNYKGVMKQGFMGCIKDLQLQGTGRKWEDYRVAKNAQTGCSELNARKSVVFPGDDPTGSYLSIKSNAIASQHQMAFNLRSQAEDGLLFYATDANQENALSASLVGGKIIVVARALGDPLYLESTGGPYNDGHSHRIVIVKDNRNVKLIIDDVDMMSGKMDGRKSMPTTSFYFGGIPPNLTVRTDNMGTTTSFVGCIQDATINKKALNFAEASLGSSKGVSLSKCPEMAVIGSTVTPSMCKLPLNPAREVKQGEIDDVRYSSQPNSYRAFQKLGANIATKSEFSLEFKTSSQDGVILYASKSDHVDFISLFMQGGQVIYAFNCGSGTLRLVSPQNYNDDNWHKVVFTREGKTGNLEIDDSLVASGDSPGSTESINTDPPLYVGGLGSVAGAASQNLLGVQSSFDGCIKEPVLNGKPLGMAIEDVSTQPCLQDLEFGTFFYSDGGYMQLYKNFTVHLDLDISLEVRPRSLSGVILSVASPGGDYMTLQMVNGSLMFSIDNGLGEIKTEFAPNPKNELCNGLWYELEIVKAKNVVILKVNGVQAQPVGVGQPNSITDTNDPLFLGGLPSIHQGIKTSEQFVGCIRNLKLDGKLQNLAAAEITGHVSKGLCPAA